MGYKRWRPSSRRDRRREARGSRGRSRDARGSDKSLVIILAIFAVCLIGVLVALAFATR